MNKEEFNTLLYSIAEYTWEAAGLKSGWHTLYGDRVVDRIREYVAHLEAELEKERGAKYFHKDQHQFASDTITILRQQLEQAERRGFEAARQEIDRSVKGVHTSIDDRYATYEHYKRAKEQDGK